MASCCAVRVCQVLGNDTTVYIHLSILSAKNTPGHQNNHLLHHIKISRSQIVSESDKILSSLQDYSAEGKTQQNQAPALPSCYC